MKLQFREKPLDLYISIGYTSAIAGVLLLGGQGNILSLFLLLFTPGYVLVAALFPTSSTQGQPGIDWIERIVLSCGLSIAIVPLLGVALNFSPWGIRYAPTVVAVALFTIGVGGIAYWRRMEVPTEQRLSVRLELRYLTRQGAGTVDKVLSMALAGSVIVFGVSVAYVVLTPQPGEPFSEFYLLGPGGNISDYPTLLNVSQQGAVTVGITSYEASTMNYAVRVDLVGLQIVHNASSGFNETLEINRTTLSTMSVSLSRGETWTEIYNFTINATGLWELHFLLFAHGNLVDPYRQVRLLVRVL